MYGKQTAVTAQQAYESSRRNGGAANVLTQEQFTKAFNTGRSSKDARIQNSAARQRGEGKVYFGQDVDYGGERYKAASEDMVSDAELGVIKTLAKITGTDVVFYQSEADMSGRYKGANGFMRNGTMYLDVNAGANRTSEESAVLLTAAHELTHYIRENNAEGYAQLRDFVTRHLIEDGADIEALAEQKAARENGLLSMDEAVEEVIADSCEMMLEDTQLPEIMAKENPGLYEQIREWIANFAEKLRKAFTGVEARHAEAKAMMKYADELSRIWDSALADAVRNTEAATENGSENVKYSYRGTRDDGIEVYETSAETRALSDSEKKKKYIQMMREQYRGRTAKFEHDGEVDYARFTGDDMRKDMYGDQRSDVRGQKAKLNVAADGDIFTLVENASYSGSEAEQGKDTKAHRNVISWDYYVKTVQIDGRMYDVLANIRKTADDSYVYSIQMNTRKTKEAALPRKAQSPEGKSFQKRARATSTESIPQSGEESNPKFSMRERDEDLQKKYPRLNLNEDISELDGVPAIELTDGSILPIKDRERYRTHVSFIEGNRIDVDDLRSGGWIGNGVYDASFTSDTARYIEQQQAKKRVAELRGVPYDQFGDGNTRYSMRDVAEDDTADERRGRQESYAELRRQNEELRRRTEYWKGQTRTTKEATVRKADTDALARRLTEELHNTDAADTVKEELKRMGDYIVQTDGQELSYAELKDWAAAIADHILSGSEAEIESGMEDARRELLDYLKSNKLKINEREMLDLPEGWKREHRRIRFGKEGLPIDTAWMELQEKFGEGAFPSDITSQSDMLFHIADMERAWQPVRGNPFENYMGEMRETVAQDILDTMLSDEIRQTAKTAADRARDRMNKAVAEERTRYNDMKSRMQERIQQVYQEGVARKQEAVAKEKAAFGFWVRNQRKMKKLCAFNEARAESFLQTYSSNTTVGEPINSRRNSISQPGTESNAGFSMFAHQNRVFFVFSQRKPPLNKTRRPQGLRVISSYSSHFHVIALITRLTDREALAGKYAVFAHIIKQLVTAYAAVYEAYSVVLLCKLPHGVLTVYVIHSYSRMRCDIPIYKALQHLCFKSVNEKAAASRSAHIIHFSAAASRKLRFQSAQQIINIRIEEHTVYRLKVHALVMYVYKLSQSILCFRGAYERRRSLCRGERMVAVSHGKKHPLPLFPAFLRKRRESGEYAPLLILGNEPAAKVPAAEHKVKIIELRELRRVYAFYYLPALIVHEDHDMRQLQRSIPADIDARRYA